MNEELNEFDSKENRETILTSVSICMIYQKPNLSLMYRSNLSP